MDALFVEHHINLDYTYGDKIYLYPFGDIHRDTDSCDVDRWDWFLSNAKKSDPDKTYYICMGDANDFASAREQSSIKIAKLHKTTMAKLDGIVQRDNRKIAKEMSFMRGKMWGMLDGNHNWTFENGVTAAEDLAERMKAPYLGWLTHITLHLDLYNTIGSRRDKSRCCIYIVACHGKAGGKLVGTSINQVDDLKKIFPVADLYIMGHDHQIGVWPTSVLIPGEHVSGLKQKRQFLCRSGSFKKGYSDGVAGYEVGSLYRPSDLGSVSFEMSLHRDRKNGIDRIITDIKAII